MAMLPHEKELVERLKDKPFALIGVNSDGKAAQVRPRFADEGITWRNAIDGGTSGPWATKWNVNGWPTLYFIDAEGVIRARDLRGAKLEETILSLIGETDA